MYPNGLRLLLTTLALSLGGCNPFYVVRVSWEEAGILLRREKIESILESESFTAVEQRKLELVLKARDAASRYGLEPRGSFEQYSKVDRDVLVWVLSATPKTRLEPYTWWYPIVGSVPYKGYFDKADAIAAGERLQRTGHDFLVRPSVAYSTLGWFDDPLLTTLLRLDEHLLIETVFHEVLHNTLWIPNHVDFNESLANFVGVQLAARFFEELGELDARDELVRRWEDELRYAEFLEQVYQELDQAIGAGRNKSASDAELLRARDTVLAQAEARLASMTSALNFPETYGRVKLNNSVILANRVYLREPQLFAELYRSVGGDFGKFLEALRILADDVQTQKPGPYELMRSRLGVASGAKR